MADIAAPRIAAALTMQELQEARQRLRVVNEELEARVEARTAELEAQKERIRWVLRSIEDAVLATDASGRLVYTNPAARDLLGLADGEQPDVLLDALLPLSMADGTPAPGIVARADAAERSRSVYVLPTSTDGQRLIVERIAPIASSATGGYVVMLRDVTEERHEEEERRKRQRLESLGVLAAGIAHDFNNLLTVVMGNLDLVEESERARHPEVKAALGLARDACEQATALPRQLISLARGGEPLREEPIRISELVEAAAAGLGEHEAVDLYLTLPADLPAVRGNPAPLARALESILRNAAEASPDGAVVELVARSERGDAGDVRVVLDVRDRGPGVAEAVANTLFDPFVTTKEGATGLGLTTAHAIVARQAGTLELLHENGSGAAFRITLRAVPPGSPDL